MRKNISNKLLILACTTIIISCKAKKQLMATQQPTQVAAATATAKAESKMVAVKAHQLNFNTFSAKANAKLNIDGSSNDVSLNIRINHDKEIWVSVTYLLGIEVARAKITPDSVVVMNKVQGIYLKKPFSYVYQYANRQITYQMLEAILTGNVIPQVLNDDNAGFETVNDKTTLAGTLQDLGYKLTLGADMKVANLNLFNRTDDQNLQVNNNNPIPAANGSLPSQIDIQSASQNKKIMVNLHYTKVDLDLPLTYPFTIPDGYTPASN